MGRMLRGEDDDVSIEQLNIRDQMVVHIYPRPNIVDTAASDAVADDDDPNNNTPATDNTSYSYSISDNNTNNTNRGGGGAHIPSITIDSSRDHVLNMNRNSDDVVPTIEIFESAQRIKMIAFILIIITSMELLTLFTIYVGNGSTSTTDYDGGSDGSAPSDPGDPTDYDANKDDSTNDPTLQQAEVRPWRNSDYIDLTINIAGFYVALLGLKVSRVYTVSLARRFYILLLCVGCAWIGYYYYMDLRQERENINIDSNTNDDSKQEDSSDKDDNNPDLSGNIYENALFAVLIPAMVWTSCFYRAWEYQHLLAEAESETSATQELMFNSNSNANSAGNEEVPAVSASTVAIMERNRDGIERLSVPSGVAGEEEDIIHHNTSYHRDTRGNASSSLSAELL